MKELAAMRHLPLKFNRVKQGIESIDPPHKEACIFRVHRGLRQVNKMAYTPVLVSIGPYHHGNPKFKAMEEHKTRYLNSLLRRTNQGVEHYVEAMIKLEQRARNCYADPFDLGGGQKSFVEVMLLDACFVIEFLRKVLDGQLRADDDPIFNQSWMVTRIFRDLMLLENQLPFFILSGLHHMSQCSPKTETIDQFPELVLQPIQYMLPAAIYFKDDLLDGTSCHKTKHFLDLVHNVCRPTATDPINIESSSSSSNSSTEIYSNMPCATELGEAGVKFKAEEEDSTMVNLFDVKLEWKFNKFWWQRILKIPKVRVVNSTEIFFRNIIAYEQHSSHSEPKYFTDYINFMDLLINTKDDVKQLCNHNIIENWLGDEEDVARMFNKFGDGVILPPSSCYSKLCKQVSDHCDRRWNKAKAKLNRDYFNSPWASVSTVAATFLLLLTLIQTLTSIHSYFNQ